MARGGQSSTTKKSTPAAKKANPAKKTNSSKGPPKGSSSGGPTASEPFDFPDIESVSSYAESDGYSQDGGDHPPNYLFHCAMTCSEDPMITRILCIPSNFTFDKVHQVMQIAFGWGFAHMWTLDVVGLRGTGLDKDPSVLWIREKEMMYPDLAPEMAAKTRDATKFKLSDVFEDEQYRGKVDLLYQYDMGDSWDHRMTFLGVEAPGVRRAMTEGAKHSQAICIGGEGHPCAEDCGGEDGWEDIKEVFAKPRMQDPEGLREWFKEICGNGDPRGLNPYAWDIFPVNQELEEIEP